MTALPDRQFFKIGEAAEIVGVKAHVLRYWESEFPSIKPLKTRGAHRMYRRADVELLCVIQKLLHHEGYTIAGARRRVRELRAELRRGDAPPSPPPAAELPAEEAAEGAATAAVEADSELDAGLHADAGELGHVREASRELGLLREASRELGLRAELIQLRRELSDLLQQIGQAGGQKPAESQPTATVTAVIAKTVLIPQRNQLR